MSAKIAVIEDDLPLAEMYKMKLVNAGYQVIVANDGQAGLDMVVKDKPDLILLDLMMPVKTGAQMLAEYRELPEGKDTKVIVLTNLSEAEAPDELVDLDVLRYLVKANYTPSQVIVVVQEALAA